ncbi:MAG: T9SS type A sorting domain-containing protein [Bacteroidales bacterium]
MKLFLILALLLICPVIFGQGIIIDHTCTDLSQIPDEFITKAKSDLKIRYFRRSHGSQVDNGGMAAIRRYSVAYAEKYNFNKTGSGGALLLSTQLSSEPWNSLDFENATWVSITRSYLDDPANAQINVIMWAWSSNFYACSSQQYLDDMEMLIGEYGPGGSKGRAVPVTFVFQTACGQKSLDRNSIVFAGNQLIRNHCKTNNRILFDFNDIECYDPSGTYFGDGSGANNATYTNARMLGDDVAYLSNNPGGSVYNDRRNWAIDWMAANPNSELTKMTADNICQSCEHSQGVFEGETKDNARLHCVLKGRAAWWLWATLAGWNNSNPTGIAKNENQIEQKLSNYPNPFNTSTFIEYALTENAKVKLVIWNNSGQMVKVLVDQNQPKGNYKIPAEINNSNGIYYYTLEVNGKKLAKKMVKL